jgi:hypothetical protein
MQMLKYRILLLITFFFINSGFTQNAENKTKEAITIVMFGNSITFQGKWEQVLNRQDVANCGIPGYTTGQLIWTIKNVLRDHPGTKIWFLEGGINDISLG